MTLEQVKERWGRSSRKKQGRLVRRDLPYESAHNVQSTWDQKVHKYKATISHPTSGSREHFALRSSWVL